MSGPWLPGVVGGAAALVTFGVAGARRPRPVRPLHRGSLGTDIHPAALMSGRQVPWRSVLIALVTVMAFLTAPPLAIVPPASLWARRRMRAIRTARRHARQVADGLPDAVDLLLLCTEAGWSLPAAHPQVAGRVTPPVGGALAAAAAAADSGRARSDAILDALAPLGDRGRALAHVLADHLRYGVPLTPGLERLSLELRLDRRRRAEVEARRVPVRLLGPLVACILPAFALLTVVPLLAASLRALPA